MWTARREQKKNICTFGAAEDISSIAKISESELSGGAVTVSFFEVPPLASDALLTTLHPVLENVNAVIR
jgi:hypothetical protein